MSKFNCIDEINNLEAPAMFIAGLKYFIKTNDIKIENKKELKKIIEDYKKLSIGD